MEIKGKTLAKTGLRLTKHGIAINMSGIALAKSGKLSNKRVKILTKIKIAFSGYDVGLNLNETSENFPKVSF